MGAEPQFPPGFLWGAATSAHQTEGDNAGSDWWALEHSGSGLVHEPSGTAAGSYHRWREDMDLLAGAGFRDYRFSIEWARIEPRCGDVAAEQLRHYRAMVEGALERGLRPMVTLHHFTVPRWFDERGGWRAPDAPELFARFTDVASTVVGSGVGHVCTINEPNLVATFDALKARGHAEGAPLPQPDAQVTDSLIRAHRLARKRLKERHPHLAVGWSVACQAFEPEAGTDLEAEEAAAAYAYPRETVFVQAAERDDWIGVQSYTRNRVAVRAGEIVQLPPPDDAERTLTGWEYHPPAVGTAVRQVAAVIPGVPIIVTENGIATDDDRRRIEYTRGALCALRDALRDGVDVRGYFHWSLLDNYEWGSFRPTFGLVAVDRSTLERTAKPSLAWLGSMAPPDPAA